MAKDDLIKAGILMEKLQLLKEEQIIKEYKINPQVLNAIGHQGIAKTCVSRIKLLHIKVIEVSK